MRETLRFFIVSWLRGLAKAGPKNGSCGGSAAQDVDKIYTMPPRESDFCEKKGMFGALLEVELRKVPTTPARESDLEVKIVKNWQARSTFGS